LNNLRRLIFLRQIIGLRRSPRSSALWRRRLKVEYVATNGPLAIEFASMATCRVAPVGSETVSAAEFEPRRRRSRTFRTRFGGSGRTRFGESGRHEAFKCIAPWARSVFNTAHLSGHESNPASPQAFDFRIVPPPADGITDCGSLPSDSGKLTSAPLLKSVE